MLSLVRLSNARRSIQILYSWEIEPMTQFSFEMRLSSGAIKRAVIMGFDGLYVRLCDRDC
jgi:hypothetical protein